MGRVSVGTTQMDIKGGDNAKRQRNIRVKKRKTTERQGQEEKVEYTGALDLENSCIPNVFGKQPCWSIDEHLRYYIQENMKTARVTDISLSCIGDKYINKLEQFANQMPDWKFWILTDQPDKVKRVLADKRHVIVPYNKPRFNYFDKLLWALDAVIETGRPVLQMDIKRIAYRLHIVEKFIDDISMVNALYNRPVYDNSCYFLSVWSPGMKASSVGAFTNKDLRFGLNYWKPILDRMGDTVRQFSPVLEHCTLFSLTPEKAKKIRENLVEIEPLFRQQSETQKNPYHGISSGEGLALGWALYINKVDTRPILTVQQVNMHNPQDFTHPWDNTTYKKHKCGFNCDICHDYHSNKMI